MNKPDRACGVSMVSAALALMLAATLAFARPVSASGWSSANALPVPLQNHVAVASGNYLYIAGGLNGTDQNGGYSALVNTTGVLGAWRTLPPLPEPLLNHAGVAQSGHLVILGGQRSTGVFPTVYTAAIQTGGGLSAWATTTPLPQPLYDLAAVAAGGYVWSLGGFGVDTRPRSVVYRAAQSGGTLGAWTTTTPLPQRLGEMGAALANGHVYVVGGRGANGIPQATAYMAPIGAGGALGAWVKLPSLPQTRWDPGVVAAGGFLWAIGGYTRTASNSVTQTNTVYRAPIHANGTIGAWQSVLPLPGKVAEHTVTAVRGFLFVTGRKVGFVDGSTVIYDALIAGL